MNKTASKFLQEMDVHFHPDSDFESHLDHGDPLHVSDFKHPEHVDHSDQFSQWANDTSHLHHIIPPHDVSPDESPEEQHYSTMQKLSYRFEHEHNHPNFKDAEGDYDHEAYSAIKSYTDLSAEINARLVHIHANKHSGHELRPNQYTDSQIFNMDRGIAKHSAPVSMRVFHGTNFNPQEKAAENEHKRIHVPTFLSTSPSQRVATRFGGYANYDKKHDESGKPYDALHKHIMTFEVPKGHSGIHVESFSHNQGEHEFILPRGMTLEHTGHVQKIRQESENFDRDYEPAHHEHVEYHVHHMRIVPKSETE